jgi:tRNA threonylcarbamoyladenosine biosynthesis protein TsaB
MNILAIDTSSEYLSLALQSARTRSVILEKIGNKHTEFALDKISLLLKEHEIAVEDLNLIAYNQGPGSFTGLRVGLSLAIGIALGLDIKLVPIPSFAIFAHAVKNKFGLTGNVLVGLDARLKQLYVAGINVDTWDYFLSPEVLDPGKINYAENIKLIGSGFETYLDMLQLPLQDAVKRSQYNLDSHPDGLNLIDLALSGAYPTVAVEQADLLYLRDKVALNAAEQAQNRVQL